VLDSGNLNYKEAYIYKCQEESVIRPTNNPRAVKVDENRVNMRKNR
jgi:hypothetical protein